MRSDRWSRRKLTAVGRTIHGFWRSSPKHRSAVHVLERAFGEERPVQSLARKTQKPFPVL